MAGPCGSPAGLGRADGGCRGERSATAGGRPKLRFRHRDTRSVYLEAAIGSKATEFRAKVGVQEYPDNPGVGSVEFIVRGDNVVLWRSGVMRGKDAAKEAHVSLAGVRELALEVTDAGDGTSSDHADWLEAVIVHDGAPLPFLARGTGPGGRTGRSAQHWQPELSGANSPAGCYCIMMAKCFSRVE